MELRGRFEIAQMRSKERVHLSSTSGLLYTREQGLWLCKLMTVDETPQSEDLKSALPEMKRTGHLSSTHRRLPDEVLSAIRNYSRIFTGLDKISCQSWT